MNWRHGFKILLSGMPAIKLKVCIVAINVVVHRS